MLTDREKELLIKGAQFCAPKTYSVGGGWDGCIHRCPWCEEFVDTDGWENVYDFLKHAPECLPHTQDCELAEYQALITRLTT